MTQIKKDTSLRKAILQAAITGQLISDVKDVTETGKQLLDRIIEERNKKLLAEWEEALKKNPKAKKPAPIAASEIDEEEIPFEIPENWCWCRLGDIFEKITDGTHKTPKYLPVGIPFLSVKDMSSGKLDFSNTKFISEEEHSELYKRCNPERGDLLITKVGTTGIPVIVDTDKVFDLFVSVALCKPVGNILDMKFMVAFINSPFIQKQIDRDTIGSANKNWVIDKIVNTLIPLPPLAVQNAIVAKLEQVLPLVDAYENAVLQKEELKSSLSDKVKKAILQEAITGKLTESWRKQRAVVEPVETTETGKQLLDRIISERNAKALADWEEKVKENAKAKKPVPVVASEIEEEEIPFEVPEGWCWCRLGDVCADFLVPQRDKPTDLTGTIPWCRIEDIEGKYIHGTHSNKYVSEETVKKMNLKVNPVGTVISANSASIGAAAITTTELCTNQTFIGLVCSSGLFNEYLYYFLLASVETLKGLGTGTTIMYISLDKYKQLYIPLPPLEEQEEIVKKVEELLPLCK